MPEPEINISSLLESPFDFVIILDPHGRILNASETTGKRFQLSNEELLGECIWDVLPAEVVARRKSFVDGVFRSGTAARFEDERQGTWLDNILIPVFNNQGETVKVAVLAYNITRRVKAEKKTSQIASFSDENPSPVIRVDSSGGILYANEASGPLLDTWGTRIGELLPEKIRKRSIDTLSLGATKETEVRCGDRVLLLNLMPIADSNFLNIYGLDITASKKAAEDLQESEERFRNLVETSHDLICRCDNDGRFTYLNPAWKNTLGYELTEMLGRHNSKFKPPEIVKKEKNLFKKMLSGTDVEGHETTYISKTGEHRTLACNARKLTDADGKTLGAQGTAHDITDRKQAEEKLQQKESHYRNLFMNSPGAILKTDLSEIGEWLRQLRLSGVDDLETYLLEKPGVLQQSENLIHIVDMNLSACKMFELEEDDEFSDIVPNIFSKNSFSLLSSLLLAIWEGRKHFKKEGSGCTSRGTSLDFILQWNTPGKDGGLDLSRGIIAITNVTETKILEKQLIQNEKMSTLGLLVSGISHEINNPNNFIMFNLPILRDYLDKLLPIIDDYYSGQQDFELFGMGYPEFREDIKVLLDNMEHGTNRINKTVSRLREFFTPQEGELLCWVDIHSVIEKSIALCRCQLTKMVKNMERIIPESLPELYTDPHALEHIITNLLINAAYAADKKESSIKLKVLHGKRLQEHLIIEVWDNGCGIDKQNMEKIFDPFFTTKSTETSSGLGMFVCYNMVKKLGGRIEVKSKPAVETTFRVILPKIKP